MTERPKGWRITTLYRSRTDRRWHIHIAHYTGNLHTSGSGLGFDKTLTGTLSESELVTILVNSGKLEEATAK